MAMKKKSSCASKKECTTSKCSTGSSKTKKIKFSIHAPGASEVLIAGDFNNWDANTRLKKGKIMWEKELLLKPGKYEYKFVVDGNWINDPNNGCAVTNYFGTQNSIIEV